MVYSAMKIIAKPPLLYSVLKPDTSSDSPSAKSKGARLVSAKMVINQAAARGGKRRKGGGGLDVRVCVREREKEVARGARIIRTILIS